MSAVRIGVIGAGWWATQHHLPSLLETPGVELAGIADADPERLARAADHFGITRRFGDAAELLAEPGLDGVMIATPHHTHHPLAKAALEAGVATFVEKPLALEPAHAWELVELAAARRLPLVVGYTLQFTRSAQRLAELVRGGELGELLTVAGVSTTILSSYFGGTPDDYAEAFGFTVTGPLPSTYSDPARAGGGQAATQLTHSAAMVCHITGQGPAEVHAKLRRGGLAVDLADALLFELRGGAAGSFVSAGVARPGQRPQQDLWYHGTEGYAVQRMVEGTVDVHWADGRHERIEPAAGEPAVPDRAPAARFAAIVAGAAESPVAPECAAHAVELVSAAYASATAGGPVTVAAR